jgi:MFS family permease
VVRTKTVPVQLLSGANFRRAWLIGGLGGTVRWLEMLSISVFTFDLTGSPLWVALLMVVRMLPMVLFGSIVGAYADRFNRKWLLVIGLSVAVCTCATLAGLALSGHLALWHVGLGAFISGTYFSTEFPVRRTVLAELAGDANAGTAMALDSATNNATRAAGPLLGGIVYQTIGLEGAYIVGTCMHLVSLFLAVSLLYVPITRASARSNLLAQLAEGLKYARSHPRILGTLLITAIVNMWGFPFATMVPVIGRDDLALSPSWVGLLASAEGTGAFVGALLIAWFSKPRHYGWLYISGSLFFLLAIWAFSSSHYFSVSWAILVTGGLGIAGFAAMQSTILLTSASLEYRSRIMGILAVCIGTGPIGVLHVGMLAEWFGARSAVAIMSLEGLLVLTLTFRLWAPVLRR